MIESNLMISNESQSLSIVDEFYSVDDLQRNAMDKLDKLKTIRPFSEFDLLNLHENVFLQEKNKFIDKFIENTSHVNQKSSFFQLLTKLKKRRENLRKCKETLDNLKTDCVQIQDNVWKISKKKINRKGKCADGKSVEAEHTYLESVYNSSSLNLLEKNLLDVQKTILDDYCLLLYNQETVHVQFETALEEVLAIEDDNRRKNELELIISSLFAFQRDEQIVDNEFDKLVKEWMTKIINCYCKDITTDGRLFLLNHVLRCPPASIKWFGSFIECPNPLNANDHDEAVKSMNFCLAMISTILSPIKCRDKFIKYNNKLSANTSKHKLSNSSNNSDEIGSITTNTTQKESDEDDVWHLLDSEFEKGEDIHLNESDLTELDIIQLLVQIPFEDLLKFLTEGLKQKPIDDYEGGFMFGEHSELAILKLISVSTQIIQILRQGLLTFNCMKFKTLTDYITLMIEKTVNCVCDFWMKFKNQISTHDPALILRIQVEYDHFILRSVVTILSCQKYGVWKFISVIPFKGITESMIWHIVWVFYNGRDDIDDLSGLCGYFSESYWKSKFNVKSVKVLFKEKLPNLTFNELENLIRSLGNMIKSRSNDDESEFVKTIAIDIFEICLFKPLTNENLINLAINIFSELVIKHPFIITSILNHIDSIKKVNENCITFFGKLTLYSWIPNDNMLKLLNKWIYNNLLSSLLNQLSRIILSRLNYQKHDQKEQLFLNVEIHRKISLIIYNSIDEHLSNNDSLEFSCSFSNCSYDQLVKLATTTSIKQFMEWSWRLLLLLKLNPNEQLIKLVSNNEIPNIYTNNDYFLLRKGFDPNNRNLYSIYICLIMTEVGQKLDALGSNLDLICHLLRNKIYVPTLKLLEFFIPLHLKNVETILNHTKFNNLFNQLLISEENYIYNRLVGLIRDQLNAHQNNYEMCNQLISFWINFICNQTVNIMKQNQNSWFINSNRGLFHVCYILDQLILNVFNNEELRRTTIDLISVKSSEMQTLKIPQSNALTSWLPLNNANKKSDDWTTPLHCLYEKYNKNIYFSFILIKADYLKIEKLWDEILFQISIDTSLTIDQVLKNVCSNFNVGLLPHSFLPVNAWAKLAVDCPNDHPLMALILFNFFASFFSSSNNGGSLGLRIVSKGLLRNVKTKINQLTDSHSKQLMKSIVDEKESEKKKNLNQLFTAFQFWVEDNHLHDAFVDLNHLSPDYMVDFLRTVFTNNTQMIEKYVDFNAIQNQIEESYKWWLEISYLKTDDVQIDYHEQIKLKQLLSFSKIEKLEMPIYKEKNKRKEFWIDLKDKDLSVIIDVLKNKIENVMEETRLFDEKLEKLAMLNVNFLSNLSELHQNVSKTLIIHVSCDEHEGCTGTAQISFEFQEDKKDEAKQLVINSNRLDYHYLLKELMQTPSKRVIDSAICLKIFLTRFQQETNQNPSKQLLSFFLTFLKDDEVITFAPASNIFNLLIDSLNLNMLFRDETTLYMMVTAINYPKLTPYFATRLCPTDCSAESFLKMYSLIQQNLFKAPSNILFVMLSKFDLNGWLKKATNEQIQQMLNSLKEALNCLGQSPENDKLVLLGLYRKHFQLILIYKFPENLLSIFKIMLNGMSTFKFTPILWKDILLSFGLYLPPDQIPADNLLPELKKYASIQPLFTASDIYSILTILNEHFNQILVENPKIELISHFQDYFHSFIPTLAAISFIWIDTNQYDLPNFNNIWLNCVEIWYLWIFPKIERNENTIVDLEYIWLLFISILQNYGTKFESVYSKMLSFLFRRLTKEFQHIDENNLKMFKIIQTKTLELNWKRFQPDQEELELMFNMVKNKNFKSERFITKILCSIDWSMLFNEKNEKEKPKAAFYIAYILVKISLSKSRLNIDQFPFHCIDIEDQIVLSRLIEEKVQIEEYLINQNESSELMFTILEMSCFVNANQKKFLKEKWTVLEDLDKKEEREHFKVDLQKRRLQYSKAFCEILSNSVRNNSSIYKKYPSELKMFFADFLYRIRIFEKDILEQHRLEVFKTILPIINSMPLDEARKINLKTLLKNASIDKTYSLNLFSVCCEEITNIEDFLNICENSIINLANSNGKIEEINNVFTYERQIPSDFILSCLADNAYLSMYLMFFKLKSSSSNTISSLYNEVGNYFLQLKLDSNLEAKTFAIWYNLLIEIEEQLNEDNLSLLPFTLKLIKVMNALTEEVSSPKFLYFIKSAKKDVSFRSMFLCLSHAALLLVKIDQVINEEHPNYAEVNMLLRQIMNKLQSFKKNKNFGECTMMIEKLINLIESKVDVKEQGIPILKSWLLAFFSDANYFELMLQEYD